MSTEPHHSITDAAADALHERIRSLETNRWAAFTNEELGDILANKGVVDQEFYGVGDPLDQFEYMYAEVQAELDRRREAAS